MPKYVLRPESNGVFYIRWSEGRRSRRISTRERDLTRAERYLRLWMERTGRSEPPPDPNVITPDMLDWEALGFSEASRPACVPRRPARVAPPAPAPPQRDKLMTEAEVAERLRCSVSKVRKLRYDGRLAFIPGRPVLVTEKALSEYLEVEERRRARTRPLSRKELKAAAAAAEARRFGGLSGVQIGRMIALRMKAARDQKAK